MGDSVNVRVEYEAPLPIDEECDPYDFDDCGSEEEVYERVCRFTERDASTFPDRDDIAALWAAVQKLRERGG